MRFSWFNIVTYYQLLATTLADVDKIHFAYNKAEWFRGRDHDINKEVLTNLTANNVFKLDDPFNGPHSIRIENYIDKVPFSQLYLVPAVKYNQLYEVRVCHPAPLPIHIQIGTTTPKVFRDIMGNTDHLGEEFNTAFHQLASSPYSHDTFPMVLVVTLYDNIVLIPSKKNTTTLDFRYQMSIDPLHYRFLTPRSVHVVYLHFLLAILAIPTLIPKFRQTLLRGLTKKRHPHTE